jgi:hypothetical protein
MVIVRILFRVSSAALEGAAKASHSWASGFVHGYKWAGNYVPGLNLIGMIASVTAQIE